jgi:hypothetical protein
VRESAKRSAQEVLLASRLSIHILALVTLLGVALGCQSMDLELDDGDRFTPSGRISYEIWPGIDQRRSGTLLDLVTGSSAGDPGKAVTARSAGIKPTISIDGAISAVEGRDHQQVPAGEQVELDVEIPGPERVKLNAENLRGHLAARGGVRFYDVLSFEGITGLGVDSTEVRLRGGGVDTTDEDLRAGLLLGVRATVRPIPLFDLYAQYLANLTETWIPIQDTEVGVELNLTRNLSLFTGYRWWKYEEGFSSESDWELDIRGPTAGASLKF